MRRVRLVPAALAAALLSSLVVNAAQANGGGPTSVLLSVPLAGNTTSLYYTEPDYDLLAELVGITGSGGAAAGEVEPPGDVRLADGPDVTATWLIHDVQTWRVDRIYLTGKGGPWIATQLGDASGSPGTGTETWQPAEDGAALLKLLDQLGMTDSATAGSSSGTQTDKEGEDGAAADINAAAGSAAAPATSTPQPSQDAETWVDRAVWAGGGLLAGLLAAMAGVRLRRRRGEEVATTAKDRVPDDYAEVLAR